MKKSRYGVALTPDERSLLTALVQKGTVSARVNMRARVLLMADENTHDDPAIRRALKLGKHTAEQIRKRYCTEGLKRALYDKPRPGQPPKITPAHDAFIVATVCTAPPEGHAHWTLDALKKTLVETYEDIDSVSHETIRGVLIRNKLKPWREKNVVHSKVDARIQGAHGRHPSTLHRTAARRS